MSPFDPKTAFFVAGLLYLVMPLTVGSILHKRHDPASVRWWCVGGVLFGLAFALVGLRSTIPDWLSIGVANPLSFGSYAIRVAVLRRELGEAPCRRSLALVWAAASGAFLMAYLVTDLDAPRVLVANGSHLLGALAITRLSWQLHRQRSSSSAAMLAAAYALFAVGLVTRVGFVLLTAQAGTSFPSSLDFALLFITAIVAALYGNLGYLGMALETISGRDMARATELAREQARRLEVERHAQEQAVLLAERTRALALRDEMVATLAHEVRQPLNNASAALESAEAVVRASTSADAMAAAYRLQRASSVLTRVRHSVDNTLADAALLGSGRPLAIEDGDIDTVVQLAVSDMDPTDAGRVRVTRATATRTAPFNQSLVRLALRNLLLNALLYSRPGSLVTLTIADCDTPLAVVIDVSDEGPGVPAALATRLFERGARGATGSRGHGLGLHIVRSVMRMHGGDAVLHANGAGGAHFRLLLPAAAPVPPGGPQVVSSVALNT